jgi:hypothetical protein
LRWPRAASALARAEIYQRRTDERQRSGRRDRNSAAYPPERAILDAKHDQHDAHSGRISDTSSRTMKLIDSCALSAFPAICFTNYLVVAAPEFKAAGAGGGASS